MKKKPFLYALGAVVYIVALTLIANGVGHMLAGKTDNSIIDPIMALSVFVLSAAVMGFLFLSEPIKLFLEGQKKEAVTFFLKIVGIFACFVVLFAVILLII